MGGDGVGATGGGVGGRGVGGTTTVATIGLVGGAGHDEGWKVVGVVGGGGGGVSKGDGSLDGCCDGSAVLGREVRALRSDSWSSSASSSSPKGFSEASWYWEVSARSGR